MFSSSTCAAVFGVLFLISGMTALSAQYSKSKINDPKDPKMLISDSINSAFLWFTFFCLIACIGFTVTSMMKHNPMFQPRLPMARVMQPPQYAPPMPQQYAPPMQR
jgi:hypothetical protein